MLPSLGLYVRINAIRTAITRRRHLRTCGKIQHAGGMLLAAASSCVVDFFATFCRMENACSAARCIALRNSYTQ